MNQRDYYRQSYDLKLDNLQETDKFWETTLPRWVLKNWKSKTHTLLVRVLNQLIKKKKSILQVNRTKHLGQMASLVEF